MTSERRPDRMNPTDATLWEIERDPMLRTTIVAVGVLDRAPDWPALQAVVARAISVVPRMRQRVEESRFGLGTPQWVDAEVDLSHHLRRIAAPGPGELRTVLDWCGPMAGEGFDRSRPLWGLTLVEGLEERRAALVLKVHHSVTDGVGGVRLLQALGDEGAEVGGAAADPRAARSAAGWAAMLERSARLSGELVGAVGQTALRPDRAVGAARSAARMLAPAGPPLSPLLTGRGPDRWAGALDVGFDELREAAHRCGGTVNDAFAAAVLGAVDRYHRERGRPADALRVMMPVSFRAEGDPEGGNRWAPVRVVLPLGIDDPSERIARYHDRLHTARREPALGFSQVLAAGLLELPPALTTGVVAAMVKGSDLCLTDVPGLRRPLQVAGATLERLYPFAPTGGAAANIGLVSHGGTACVGLNVDRAAVADPGRLTELVVESFDEVLRADPPPRRRAGSRTDGHLRGPASAGDGSPPPAAGSTGFERLSALDTSFLRMESRNTPMHLGALYVLDGGPLTDEDGRFRLDEVRRHIASRLGRLPKLRSRLVEVPFGVGRPVWVDDLEFDVAHHVRTTTLAAPGDEGQLLALCEQLHMEPLERSRPLWELWFVPGLSGGRVGLVEKVHHSLLDGVAGVELVTALFDLEPAPDVAPNPLGPAQPEPGRLRLLAGSTSEWLGLPAQAAGVLADVALRPVAFGRRLRSLGDALGALVQPAITAPATSLNRPVGSHRRLLPITVDLDDVHATGRALGGTINDVVLAAVTAGLRQLLVERGEPVSGVGLHVLVPKSTRHAGLGREPGNQVAAILAELPVGDPDPLGRLHTIEARMRRLKDRHQAEGSELLLGAGDLLPSGVVGALARLVARQRFVNLVVTNVPGPPVPLYFNGARLLDVVPIVPLGGNLTVAVAVVSYDGRLTIAFHADRDACPDLPVLATATERALSELAELAARSNGSQEPASDS
jgi:diacylglycerol O-acyltransferase / wax synthase